MRLIPFSVQSAALNMAIDEAIMESVRAGISPPTLRLYGWKPGAISIGYFQGLHNEVDLAACARSNTDVVRRITGGGAVYHAQDGEITYSIIAPQDLFPADIIASYRQICEPIIAALGSLGIQASFQPINDIIVGDRKISGNAQTRKGGILLQHGTLLYTVDVDLMFSLLTVGKEKTADKLIQSVKKRVTCIREHTSCSLSTVQTALITAFGATYTLEQGTLLPSEISRAEQLAKEKYSSKNWVGQR